MSDEDRISELESELEGARAERDRALAARDALVRQVLPLGRGASEPTQARLSLARIAGLTTVLVLCGVVGYLFYLNHRALRSIARDAEPSLRKPAPPPGEAPPGPGPRVELAPAERGIEILPIRELALLGRAAIAPDGKALALAEASEGGGLLLRSLGPGGSLAGSNAQLIRAHQAAVRDLAFSRDGSRLLSASADGALKVWDRKGRAERTLRRSGSGLHAVVAGRTLCAAAGEGPGVFLYRLDGSGKARTLAGHRDWVRALALDSAEQRIASGGHDTTILIHSTATGAVERSLKGHTLWVSALAFSPDGKLLASAGWDNRVLLWDLAGGPAPRRLRGGPVRAATSLAFSSDGTQLAAGSLDRSIVVFEVQSGRRSYSLDGHRYQVQSALFDPLSGRAIFSSSSDGTLRRWPLPPLFAPVAEPLPPPAPGEVTLRNNTSGERLRIRLLEGRRVSPAGARALARFLRCGADDRSDSVDPELVRLLDAVAERFGRARELIVVSGYRSAEYNRLRRKQSREVAKESQHLEGKAIDLRVEGVTITALRDFLKQRRKGGVGFYPDSNFVHMDTGRVRSWSGE